MKQQQVHFMNAQVRFIATQCATRGDASWSIVMVLRIPYSSVQYSILSLHARLAKKSRSGFFFFSATHMPLAPLAAELLQRRSGPNSVFRPRLANVNLPNGNSSLGMPRFTPRSEDELSAAVFTWWDILDAVMLKADAGYRFMAGYVREYQVRRMWLLARRPAVRTFCETGFNGGHSAVAMLLASATLVVHSFDTFSHKYSAQIVDLLSTRFGGRLQTHAGDSHLTLRARGTIFRLQDLKSPQ